MTRNRWQLIGSECGIVLRIKTSIAEKDGGSFLANTIDKCWHPLWHFVFVLVLFTLPRFFRIVREGSSFSTLVIVAVGVCFPTTHVMVYHEWTLEQMNTMTLWTEINYMSVHSAIFDRKLRYVLNIQHALSGTINGHARLWSESISKGIESKWIQWVCLAPERWNVLTTHKETIHALDNLFVSINPRSHKTWS